MGRVDTAEMAGSVVRRVREDRGMSRAQLANATGIGARTLYALETGESENFGLGKYLKVLDALGLSMSVKLDGQRPTRRYEAPAEVPYWDDLADVWALNDAEGQ